MLVADNILEETRKIQGWNVPGMKKVHVKVAPSDEELYSLLDNTAIHVFSGINAYTIASKAFTIAVKKKLKVGVLLEPYNFIGVKGIYRRIKYRYLKYRYNDVIDFIAATGELGIKQYESVGFDIRKLFEWGYFVEPSKILINNKKEEKSVPKPSILFVGSIDDRKNIIPCIDTIKKIQGHIEIMTIVGDGPLKDILKAKIQRMSVFDYKGNLSNNEVKTLMFSHDILILPSKFDGWGAVVNEALHAGMRVVASENCGASVLLDGVMRGEKFYFREKNNFEVVLLKWIMKGSLDNDERMKIAEWANNNISGKSAADYFEKVVSYVYEDKSQRPSAPWR